MIKTFNDFLIILRVYFTYSQVYRWCILALPKWFAEQNHLLIDKLFDIKIYISNIFLNSKINSLLT